VPTAPPPPPPPPPRPIGPTAPSRRRRSPTTNSATTTITTSLDSEPDDDPYTDNFTKWSSYDDDNAFKANGEATITSTTSTPYYKNKNTPYHYTKFDVPNTTTWNEGYMKCAAEEMTLCTVRV
jgi:hypothetical protein